MALVTDAVGEQFCRGVLAATRAKTVFPAFLFRPFDPATTKQMITNLPALSEYRPLPHPDSVVDRAPSRFAMPLNQNSSASPFWLGVADAMRSAPVRHAIASALDLETSSMHPAVALLRDLPGYKIGIHPDSRRKLATAQIYLACHTASPHIGARFFRKDRDGFTQTDAAPYLPGSGYFFRRSETSWHGVETVTENDGLRDSLMLVYFDSPKTSFT